MIDDKSFVASQQIAVDPGPKLDAESAGCAYHTAASPFGGGSTRIRHVPSSSGAAFA